MCYLFGHVRLWPKACFAPPNVRSASSAFLYVAHVQPVCNAASAIALVRQHDPEQTELVPKRLELLRELIPTANIIALLVNPTSPFITESISKDLQSATRALGLQLHILNASTEHDFDTVFATFTQLRADVLVIAPDAMFISRSELLGALTLRQAVPAVTQFREFAAAGGLMSYGGSFTEPTRLVGIYTGRVLKGEKPADLPVMQATKVELVINLKTAKALGINVPNTLIGRADEVIE